MSSSRKQFNLWLVAWLIKVFYRPILNASENAGLFYLSKDQGFRVMSLQWLLALFLYIAFPIWVHKLFKKNGRSYGFLVGLLPLIITLILERLPLSDFLPAGRFWIYIRQDIGPNLLGLLIVYLVMRKLLNK